MTCPTEPLSSLEIQSRLQALPHWAVQDNALERVYQANSYLEALDILNKIARQAEAANHHPDLILSWRKLTVRYWTHTSQGITELDFEQAHQVESILAQSS